MGKMLRAVVSDYVQVRNVEFFVNGQRLALDGSFPFEVVYRVPTSFVGTNLTFTARLRDTGGNTTTVGVAPLDVVPDTLPPVLVINSPANNSQWFLYDDPPLRVTALDPDGIAGLAFLLNGSPLPVQRITFTDYHIARVLPPGTNLLTAIATDYAGLSTTGSVRVVVLRQAISREISVFNFGPPDKPEAISRELSVFNFGPADKPEAVSRELSVFNFGPADKPEAISRELSVFNFGPADRPEAISREVSVFNGTNSPAGGPQPAGQHAAQASPERK